MFTARSLSRSARSVRGSIWSTRTYATPSALTVNPHYRITAPPKSTNIQANTSYRNVTHPDSEAPQSTHDLIKDHSRYLLNTYARPPILFTHAKGLTLTDSSNRDYLDFTAGIAVTALGHADEGVSKVMTEQASKLGHASNVYWNEYAGELAKLLVEQTRQHGGLGLKDQPEGSGAKVFFSNSGTEANEGALKFARKYGKEVGGENKTGIVCFANAFHGRSMGALSVTPNPKYQAPFAPLIPGVRVGELNDMDEARINALVDENTCGVIVEPIQGEGGVTAAKPEWLELLAKRAREVGAVLIYDEIQVRLPFVHADISAACSAPATCGHTLPSPAPRSPISSLWPNPSQTVFPSGLSWFATTSQRRSASGLTVRHSVDSPWHALWVYMCFSACPTRLSCRMYNRPLRTSIPCSNVCRNSFPASSRNKCAAGA